MSEVIITIVSSVISILVFDYLRKRFYSMYCGFCKSQYVGYPILITNMRNMLKLLTKPVIILEESQVEDNYFKYVRPENGFGTGSITILFSYENILKRNKHLQEMFLLEYDKMIKQLPSNRIGVEDYVEELNLIKSEILNSEYLYVTVELPLSKDGSRNICATYSLMDIEHAITMYKITHINEDYAGEKYNES